MASTLYWKAGGLLGATAIGLGAMGRHSGLDDAKKTSLKIAAEYQLLHAVTLLVLSSTTRLRVHPAAMPLMLGGTCLFSGSIYLLVLNRDRFRFLGPVTPLGGLAMMAGWASLLL
ncbi:hypothetical protein BDF14DRAFT_1803989 [Spinellus fusiger]|nr:hypothetical protein BDF14DRAFT_1803989 [Spinellus fusiger]